MKEVVTKQTQESDTFTRVQSILDEYGDFSSQPGVVREAGFAFPNSAAVLEVKESVDPNNLDGPSVVKVMGGDDRNAVRRLSPEVPLDPHTEAALRSDLDLYVDRQKADDFKRRFGEKVISASRPSLR
jgi:hypothetical protein